MRVSKATQRQCRKVMKPVRFVIVSALSLYIVKVVRDGLWDRTLQTKLECTGRQLISASQITKYRKQPRFGVLLNSSRYFIQRTAIDLEYLIFSIFLGPIYASHEHACQDVEVEWNNHSRCVSELERIWSSRIDCLLSKNREQSA